MSVVNEDEDQVNNGTLGNKNVKKKKGSEDSMDTTPDEKTKEEQEIEQANQQRLNEISVELQDLRQGTHVKYLEKLEDLKKQKEERLLNIERFKEMQMQSVMNQCESEIQQTHSDYDNDVVFAKQNLIDSLQREEKRIKEAAEQNEKGGRTLRKRGMLKDQDGNSPTMNPSNPNAPPKPSTYETYTKKKKLPANVGIEFTLTVEEINDDLSQINRTRSGSVKKWSS